MRVLFTAQPLIGHLNSLTTLARALERAGHTVAVASARSFGPAIEAAGLAAFPAGSDWSNAETTSEAADDANREAGLLSIFGEVARRGMIDDIVALGREWRPDLIIRDGMEYGGWIAAELLGVPLAAQATNMGCPRWVLHTFSAGAITSLPGDYGLEPDPQLERLYRYPYLHAKPASLDPPGLEPLPAGLRFRPGVFDAAPALEELPDWVAALDDRPVVHATLGTVVSHSPLGHRAYEAIIEALRDEPVNLVVSVGPQGDPESYGPQPPNVRLERFVPHRAFMPHCDVVINHGGFSSLVVAAASRIPICFLALTGDQPILAHLYVQAGVGIACAAAPEAMFPMVIPERLDAGEIRAAVRSLLAEPGYRLAAERLHAEFMALPPPERAVEALEQVVREHRSARSC